VHSCVYQVVFKQRQKRVKLSQNGLEGAKGASQDQHRQNGQKRGQKRAKWANSGQNGSKGSNRANLGPKGANMGQQGPKVASPTGPKSYGAKLPLTQSLMGPTSHVVKVPWGKVKCGRSLMGTKSRGQKPMWPNSHGDKFL
jgi:hypothetical protein